MVGIAVVKFISATKMQSRAGLGFILKYCAQDSKTALDGASLISGINCLPQSAYHEFMATKLNYGKDDGRIFYHLFQSFPKEELITPQTVHEIAVKLASHFDGYEVLIATHIDREHIHSHLIVNSVSYNNGRKYHANKDEIKALRDKSDELCREHGLSICQPKADNDVLSQREYRSAVKGESWKFRLINTIEQSMNVSYTKDEFIANMQSLDYGVKWSDTRANITYTTPNGKLCRGEKLHDTKFTKENMENEFNIRGAQRAQQPGAGTFETLSAQSVRNTRGAMAGDCYNTAADRGAFRQTGQGDGETEGRGGQHIKLDGQRGKQINAGSDGASKENRAAICGAITTGWEESRAVLAGVSSAHQLPAKAISMDTPQSFPVYGGGRGLAADLLRLGKNLERCVNEDDDFETMANIAALLGLSFAGIYALASWAAEQNQNTITDEDIIRQADELIQEPENMAGYNEQNQWDITL